MYANQCMIILFYTDIFISFIYNCIVRAHGLDKLNDKDILSFMCQSLTEYSVMSFFLLKSIVSVMIPRAQNVI